MIAYAPARVRRQHTALAMVAVAAMVLWFLLMAGAAPVRVWHQPPTTAVGTTTTLPET